MCLKMEGESMLNGITRLLIGLVFLTLGFVAVFAIITTQRRQLEGKAEIRAKADIAVVSSVPTSTANLFQSASE